MAGIPGLRNMWGAIGDSLDWVGDVAQDAVELIASPFVDEEGELFGFIGMDDLKTAYKNQKARASGKPLSKNEQRISKAVESVGQQSLDLTVSPTVAKQNPVEPYPNYLKQSDEMPDFTQRISDIIYESSVPTKDKSITKGPNIQRTDQPITPMTINYLNSGD
jgi:hypothetical protein